jgi:hypothetical protein
MKAVPARRKKGATTCLPLGDVACTRGCRWRLQCDKLRIDTPFCIGSRSHARHDLLRPGTARTGA